MKTLEHYTFNTGHVYRSPRSEFKSSLKPHFQAMIRDGFNPLPQQFGEHYFLRTTPTPGDGLLATVYRHSELRPLIEMAVAPSQFAASQVWPLLAETYSVCRFFEDDFWLSADARQPETYPWCGVVILPELIRDPNAARWLGDFERCLAWTWLESRKTLREVH